MSQTYTMDPMIKVDGELCINCGGCIRACPAGLPIPPGCLACF